MLQKMWKKLLLCSMLICLLTAVCIQVNAAEQIQDDMFTYDISDDGTATVTGTVNSYPAGHVEIPSQVNGYPVVAIDEYAFGGYSDITSVTFPDTLQTIENNAFDGCVGITAIEIPDSVTLIESQAFFGCSALNQVSLPDTAIELWSDIFNGTALKENSANWENGIFYADNHLIDLSEDYHQYDSCHVRSGTVTIANQALYHAAVSKFSLPDGLKRIGHTLLTADLDSLVIPGSVEIIGDGAFGGITCRKLIIEDGVKYIGEEAFQLLHELTELTIPGSVEIIGAGAFDRCFDLKKLTLAEGVKEIHAWAFQYCSSLEDISFPSSLISVETNILEGTAYSNDVHNWITGLLYVDDCLVTAKSDLKGAITIKEGTRLIANELLYFNGNITKVTLPDSVQYIGHGSFGSSGAEEVNFPAGLVFIGDGAFENCKFTKADLPDGLTYLGTRSFYGCSSLKEVHIPNSLTEILPETFSGCSLTELSIPANIKMIGQEAFRENHSMAKLTFAEGITRIEPKAFLGCEQVSELILPNSLVFLGEEAFSDCRNLQALQFSTSLSEIPAGAFHACAFQELTVPGNIKTICQGAFGSNGNLRTLIILEGVTTLEKGCFENSGQISYLELPSTLQSVGDDALYIYGRHDKNAVVNYNGTREQWEKVTIGESNLILDQVTTLDDREPEETEPVVNTQPLETVPEETQESVDPTSPFIPGGDNGNSGGSNSTVIIVIVVVVLAAAGVGGWFILSKKKN